jgi:hypothetical protein
VRGVAVRGEPLLRGDLAGTIVEKTRPSRDLTMLSEDAARNTAALDEELFVRPKWRYR